ncbi:integral membrane protein [Rutstroemia sp. NJR-2017a BVV2]|nr:integral membrane protein [Rutstroemia sp. NJR-2017a BVV2]
MVLYTTLLRFKMAPPITFPPPINPDDLGRGPMIIGLTWSFTGLAVIAVSLRLYIRKKIIHITGWDDWLMLASVILQVTYQALATVSFTYGLGKHDLSLRQPDEMINVLKWNWIASPPGMLVSILARISITILLLRLFGIHLWLKWYLIIFTGLQTLVGGLIIPFTWVQDDPVSGLWNIYDPTVKHWDPRIVLYMEYLGQSMYTFSDLTYVLFPVIIIWRLKMPLSRRIGLILLMCVSLFTMTMSLLKVMVVQGSSHASTDVQYQASLGVLWSGMEQTCVIIMGCVPTLRSITNLEIPGLSAISSSLSSLIRGNKSKQSSLGNGYSDPGYRDLELNTHRLGQLGKDGKTQGPTVTIYPDGKQGSRQNLVVDNHVHRTDQFSLSYDQTRQSAE